MHEVLFLMKVARNTMPRATNGHPAGLSRFGGKRRSSCGLYDDGSTFRHHCDSRVCLASLTTKHHDPAPTGPAAAAKTLPDLDNQRIDA